MGLYGDEYFVNEEIKFNNILSMLESTYSFDNDIFVSIDESFGDTVKKYVEKFIEFLRKCKEAIGKALEFIKRKIKEITSKIFNKANKKVMKEAFEYAYENCPDEKEIDELEKRILNFCKIANVENVDLMKERVVDFIATGKRTLLFAICNTIIIERNDNNYKTAQAAIDFINYIGTIKNNKEEYDPVNYNHINNEPTVVDKQNLAFVYFKDNPFDKKLQQIILDNELEISKLSKEEYHNMINTDESAQIVNEVVDKSRTRGGIDRSFNEEIYSRFDFPTVKNVFIPTLSSSINKLEVFFESKEFDSLSDEQITKNIILMLDIKDIFKDFKSVQDALNTKYSDSYISNLKDTIINAMESIIMDKYEGRDYFTKKSKEFGFKTISGYYDNNENIGSSLTKIFQEYQNFYAKEIIRYGKINDTEISKASIEKKIKYLREINNLSNSILSFCGSYIQHTSKAGISMIKYNRDISNIAAEKMRNFEKFLK